MRGASAWRLAGWRSWAWLVLVLAWRPSASGQIPLTQLNNNRLPGTDYYQIFGLYYEGEYRRAANDFARAAQTAWQAGSARFLDTACAQVMNGECRFQLGDWPGAIAQYELALTQYVDYTKQDWQSRITQPTVINAQNGAIQRAQITWYTPQRAVAIPGLPDTMQMLFGNLFAEQALVTGGVVANPEFRQVDVMEIMRTTAIALQRRRWIKGPLAADAFSRQVVDGLSRAGMADASILSRCNGVLFGLAQAGNGELDRARETLAANLQFGAGLDHPLTAIALLELARIHRESGDAGRAQSLALEASFVAAVFNQYDIVEQSLALGTEIHLLSERTAWPPLQPAIAWAGRNRARPLQVSAAVRLADCLAEAGQVEASLQLLDDTQRTAQRSDVMRGPIAGRIGYLRAVNQFWAGNFDAGRQTLGDALQVYAPGSRWLYQLGLLNQSVARGQGITSRQADVLYEQLLGDPQEVHWRTDPLEAMSYLASPHLEAIEAWLQIAIENRAYDRAVAIAELLRRHRFFATLPLGGRLMSLRWVMHGPATALNDKARAQRTDFMTRVPAYAELTAQAGKARDALLRMPLRPEAESEAEVQQRDLFVELMNISQKQEAMLASFALRREPAEMGFPPDCDVSGVRGELSTSIVLYVAATARGCWIFELSARGTQLVASHRPKDVQGAVNRILKATGLDQKQLTLEQLNDTKWREVVLEETAKLLPGWSPAGQPPGTELVIVPDGNFWNLPIETCLFGADPASAKTLVEHVRPRYSPTLALALVPSREWRKLSRTAVMEDRLADSLAPELTAATVDELVKPWPDAAQWADRLMIPGSLLTAVTDQFLVLTQMGGPPRGGPFALLPLVKDQGRTGNNLAAWLSLPLEGAESVVLPCFESAGATGVGSPGDGQDLFLTTMGLVASGARTVMISRWPTRGKSSLDFTTHYLQAAETALPAAAMEAARAAVRTTPLVFADESRVRTPPQPPVAKCEHPLFWAGYMVIDVPTINPPPFAAPAGDASEVVDPAVADPGAAEPALPESPAMDPAVDPAIPDEGGEGGGIPAAPDDSGTDQEGEPTPPTETPAAGETSPPADPPPAGGDGGGDVPKPDGDGGG